MTCLTCGRPVDPRSAACTRCGTPPGHPAVWLHLPLYRVRGVAVAAVILLALTAIVYVAGPNGLLPVIGERLARTAAQELDPAPLNLAGTIGLLLTVLCGLLGVAAAALALTWFWRARKNLDAFPGARPAMASGWAIGGWFLPGANLVIPLLVMDGLARASLWRRRTPALVMAWWVTTVAAGVTGLAVAVVRLVGDQPRRELTGPEDFQAWVDFYRAAVPWNLAAVVFVIPAAVAASVLISRISRAQTARVARALAASAAAASAGPQYPQPPLPPPAHGWHGPQQPQPWQQPPAPPPAAPPPHQPYGQPPQQPQPWRPPPAPPAHPPYGQPPYGQPPQQPRP